MILFLTYQFLMFFNLLMQIALKTKKEETFLFILFVVIVIFLNFNYLIILSFLHIIFIYIINSIVNIFFKKQFSGCFVDLALPMFKKPKPLWLVGAN